MDNISNLTNMRDTYTIEGRFMAGVRVIGYYLSTSTGAHCIATAEQVKQLAINKRITNCTAQWCGDEIRIKGLGVKLSKLPVVQQGDIQRKAQRISNPKAAIQQGKFALEGRCAQGKNIEAYILTDSTGRYKVSRAKVMQLARAGRIVNARVQMSNGKEILRGTRGTGLRDLPVVR